MYLRSCLYAAATRLAAIAASRIGQIASIVDGLGLNPGLVASGADRRRRPPVAVLTTDAAADSPGGPAPCIGAGTVATGLDVGGLGLVTGAEGLPPRLVSLVAWVSAAGAPAAGLAAGTAVLSCFACEVSAGGTACPPSVSGDFLFPDSAPPLMAQAPPAIASSTTTAPAIGTTFERDLATGARTARCAVGVGGSSCAARRAAWAAESTRVAGIASVAPDRRAMAWVSPSGSTALEAAAASAATLRPNSAAVP